MDMHELTEEGARRPTRITFDLVDSAMFAAFDGEWRVQPYSRVRSRTDPTRYDYKSKLSYPGEHHAERLGAGARVGVADTRGRAGQFESGQGGGREARTAVRERARRCERSVDTLCELICIISSVCRSRWRARAAASQRQLIHFARLFGGNHTRCLAHLLFWDSFPS